MCARHMVCPIYLSSYFLSPGLVSSVAEQHFKIFGPPIPYRGGGGAAITVTLHPLETQCVVCAVWNRIHAKIGGAVANDLPPDIISVNKPGFRVQHFRDMSEVPDNIGL